MIQCNSQFWLTIHTAGLLIKYTYVLYDDGAAVAVAVVAAAVETVRIDWPRLD